LHDLGYTLHMGSGGASRLLAMYLDVMGIRDCIDRLYGPDLIDAFKIGSLYQTQAGVALSLVPDRYFDDRFAEVMNEFADDIEAGRSLRPLDAETAGVRRMRDSTDPDVRRAQARQAQREAVRPMNDARPTVDPNAAADAYLHGRRNPNDGWSR